ncbi:hypothetical protein [Thermococcus sp.]|uniref:hypothetical protein n=1 Tax=Thermococcus sp. TaxID=35749 RepID=UPI002638A417|nr:hypothetical protein [Thermococcus sp.]
MKKLDTVIAYYPVLMVIVYAAFTYRPLRPYLDPYLLPVEVFLSALLIARLFSTVGFGPLSGAVKGLGIAIAVYYLPVLSGINYNLSTALAIFVVGVSIASLAGSLGGGLDLLVRGIGVGIAVTTPYFVPRLGGLGSSFLYLGTGIAALYILAFVEKRFGGVFIERHLLGLILLVIIVFGYAALSPYLSNRFPRYAVLVQWGVVVASLFLATVMINSNFSTRNFGAYLVGEWRRHEGEVTFLEDVEFKDAKKAVEDFVLNSQKAPLVSFIAFYGSSVMSRSEMEELLRPVVDYEDTRVTPFTPLWLVKKYARKDAERRRKIVESVFKELRSGGRINGR